MSYEKYFGKMNGVLSSMGSRTHVVNINPLQWYNIGTFCEAA